MGTNPIEATHAIQRSYLNYLATTFRFKDPVLQNQFLGTLGQQARFVKGPILEATPAFTTGSSVAQMIEEGVLSARFLALDTPSLPPDRPLYRHQEDAVRKLVVEGRNIVVATGTGSGKTETFLIPILNHLFREDDEGTLGPGVRALLLYPMNALANDQLARLRKLLGNYPNITFGRYTGETELSRSAAFSKHRRQFGTEPLSNELISRQEMWESPPHILLTNYAMLEYLLLRPRDSVFFDGEYAGNWHFIVIDEAHTYAGAKGIEVAMLLRRLKDRVMGGESRRMQCVATSATLGRGKDAYPAVARFASELLGEPFEWVADDPARQDVIEAWRLSLVQARRSWGRPKPEVYVELQRVIKTTSGSSILEELVEAADAAGVPPDVVAKARLEGKAKGWRAFLYGILEGDAQLLDLQQELEREPQPVQDLAERLLPDDDRPLEKLVALVDLANQAKMEDESQPLLPARYHLFVRAIEGAYVSLGTGKRLYLERRESVTEGGKEYPVFEVAACRQCGATYLVGNVQDVNGKQVLRQVRGDGANADYYLLLEADMRRAAADEDEDVGFPDIPEPSDRSDEHWLCASCGAIGPTDSLLPPCDCDGHNRHTVLRIQTPRSRKGRVFLCPACGKRSPGGMVWRFVVGTDAAASVLATALYQQIEPSKSKGDETDETHETPQRYDPWAPFPDGPVAEETASAKESTETRKLLIFSDSRQDAAFFAPYLDRTYNHILRRRLITETLREHREDAASNRWRLQDLIDPLGKATMKAGLFPGYSLQERKNEVWKWVLHEFLALDRRISLEGLGLLGFALVKPGRGAHLVYMRQVP